MSWGKIRYFTLVVILFLNLFTIIKMGFRINYIGELLIFILFLIASLIILISQYKEKSYGLFTAIFFIISLLNLFYIKSAFYSSPIINVGWRGLLLFGTTMLLNAVGFLIGVFSITPKMTEKEKEEIIEKVIEPKIKETEKKLDAQLKQKENEIPIKEEKVEPWPSVTEAFYPGKYIASKKGAVYHAPKCDWAKKISRSQRVWFKSDEEAKKNGYRKHSCLKR